MGIARTATFLAFAALAAIPASAPAAFARGPSAADQGSMDWILQRFAKDREEENKSGTVVDPVTAFRTGEGPLEGDVGWKAMAALLYNPTEKPARKTEAATAIVERFKWEDERVAKIPEDGKRREEQKALGSIKMQVVLSGLNARGMLGSNQSVLAGVHRIQKALLPTEWVTWTPVDTLKTRRKACEDLLKRVK